ncbi:hypothetical protein DXT99_12280 [Pontibacter diazotrophicus]|uniref:Uncharacterized protein n=1 Tax=Pontibacter diazotrophicus TaxID=1400979 RepID=A0A3D8LBM1_9BACT|nr:hypothetical protein [Pontibacter diazotrophicus]RDV14743.1 hypothetical protein DXT99_12280 [Pontibacter diazotrophicus]
MAGLQADNINPEFLRNFITETIYVVEGDVAAVPSLPPAVSTAPPAPEEERTAAETKPETAVKNLITDHAPVATPQIPKSPDAAAAVAKAVEKYDIAGANAKGVVVLVTLPDDEFNKLPQLQFLQKILGAIGLQPAGVAYVNNKTGATALFEDLQQALQVNYIISFASRLDTTLPHDKFTLYHPVMVGDVPVVFSQALSMLETDMEHKKKLWGALQQVFL